METAQTLVIKEAAKFILVREARALQSDLKFGSYSEDVKQVISEKIDEVKNRIDKLNHQQPDIPTEL